MDNKQSNKIYWYGSKAAFASLLAGLDAYGLVKDLKPLLRNTVFVEAEKKDMTVPEFKKLRSKINSYREPDYKVPENIQQLLKIVNESQ